jgi:hypothetical protein
MISLSKPFFIHSYPSLRALLLALPLAAVLLGCTDTRTAVCLNGVRCPAGLMCVEPYGYCALPEDVMPCLGKAEDDPCVHRGEPGGICRLGVCGVDKCEETSNCNDGNPCTRDTCVGETCRYEPLDDVSCDDGNFCNGADICVSGVCEGHSGDPCTRGNTYCDRAQNACIGCTPGGGDCPEGIFGEWSDCTGADGTCSQDGLQTRTAITFTCDTDGVCQPSKGTETQACMRSTDGVSCSDANLCTTNDQCNGGACGGQAKVCYDGNECTTDTCSPGLGCQYIPVPFGERCGFGNCDGMGGCVTCANVGQACSTGNSCERGEIRCVDGNPTCIAVGPAAAGTVCNAAAGACDLPEVCNGADTICPTDRFQQGTTCRAAVNGCDIREVCDGSSASCPADDPGCATDEYCFNAQCFASPSIDIQGTDEGNELCADLGIPHPAPGFLLSVTFRGRAGAAFRYLRRHVSCPGSLFTQGPVDCDETPTITPDTVLPSPEGICTFTLANDMPDTACPSAAAGRWEVFAEVDGVAESNHDFTHGYNSTVSCPDNPPPTDCASAFSFCPCTGACNAADCPSPGVCPLRPDAGVTAGADTNFSTAEGEQ